MKNKLKWILFIELAIQIIAVTIGVIYMIVTVNGFVVNNNLTFLFLLANISNTFRLSILIGFCFSVLLAFLYKKYKIYYVVQRKYIINIVLIYFFITRFLLVFVFEMIKYDSVIVVENLAVIIIVFFIFIILIKELLNINFLIENKVRTLVGELHEN